MKTTPCNFVFLHPKDAAKFLDQDIYNMTCTNHLDEPFMVEYMKKPLQDLGIEIQLKPFLEIDKSQSWFIDLPMLFYKWQQVLGDGSRTLFDSFPDDVMNEVNHGNAYLIFNQQNETDTILTYEKFHEYYSKNPKARADKILLMSPSRLAAEIYHNWCEEKQIPKEQRVKIIYASHIDMRFNDWDINYWANAPKVEKDKLFINLNRVPRTHRIYLVAALYELGLFDKGIVSLWFNWDKSVLFNEVKTRKDLFCKTSRGKQLYDIIYSGVEKIQDKLPFLIDQTDLNKNPAGFSASDRTMYSRAYINLTCTTFFFEWQEPSPGWNEKEWKPVVAKQPFILFGRYGALQSMKNFGILTFDQYIDESYDYIKDDYERFWFILQELERLSKLPKEQLDNMLEKMQFILDYNLNYTNTKRWEQVFHTSGLKELIKYHT